MTHPAQVGLRSGDKESPGFIDLCPPCIVAIGLVENIGEAFLEGEINPKMHIVDSGSRDLGGRRQA